jgi:PEGA domain
MTTLKPAAERRPHRVLPLAAAALLLASLPLAAQTRSRPSDSGHSGRTARESGSSRGSSSHGNSSPSHSSPSYSAPRSSESSSGREPRTARPSSGSREPHRQPPSRSGRGNGGSHGHHGGSGGFYYPYGGYYGGYYGSYGFWPGFWGGWGGWWGGYPYNYPYGGYEHGQPIYYGREGQGGALDLDVAPGRTEVYVDGQYLGKVDAFDGWPRYLWLPKGTYDIVFYLDGYETIARQITVYPGSVIGIDDSMEPGDSVRPEDLATKTHDRRDDRLRYERERRDRIDRGERVDRGDDEDWRDRVRRNRGSVQGDDRDDRVEDENNGRDDRHDVDVDEDDEDIDVSSSSAKGRLRLDVEPEDASVYLDGRFVGTGTDLALMRGGLPIAPGDHKLAIVRPGRKAEERNFEVKAGEDVELEIDLDSGR